MSGVRVAAFSKYFAIGALCAALVCARHSAFLVADDSLQFQRVCTSVARYADEAAALEEYVESQGLSIAKIQSKMNLPWPAAAK
ncbi:hypothetical protein LDHU3_17.1510:CDS1 [Leishmania donovani]|uniref:Hypothetical_protein n=2 Tax=Leishmania donovani species complex TaxID=38574 RepID=A0A6L0X9Q5_LEIIN|nr:hypothetical_protein [Leishmania infantum]CAJ1987889.1 hypothetical protein LDHU3_17.1510:CDS1 [Leishmania donovani]SUZ40871.1 hypothetical_protein [Leishmania infantum]VDZ43776.1 hypothetical_protein [Leishmania donovani]